jgi:hypothetical protein
MSGEKTRFNSKTGRQGGKKSKRKPLDQKVQEFVNKEIKKGTGVTYLDAFLQAMAKEALKGNTQAFDKLLDRGFGKSKQNIALTGQMEHNVVESPLDKFQKIQAKIDRLEKKNRGKK